MRPVLENPFYYLDNFQRVLAWVGRHHGDLLDDAERDFIDRFAQLPQASRALLVRMVMRKGTLFRASKLNYAEIGCVRQAAKALVAHGWLDPAPLLSLEALSSLLTKGELLRVFPVGLPAQLRKAEVLEQLRAQHREPRSFADWCGRLDDQAFALAIDALCERLRLMFFGNLHQGWSDFVLADLGIHRYEQVAFSPDSRAFHCRRELDAVPGIPFATALNK